MHRGERWIIRHVDVKVVHGELVYLIGANGADKSTCAKAVLGLIGTDEGTVGIFAVASAVVLAMFYLERRDTLPTDTLLGRISHGGLVLGVVSGTPRTRTGIGGIEAPEG